MATKTKKLQLDLSDRDNSRLLRVIRDLQEACKSIIEGFYWDNTKQGDDYWRNVHSNLEEIIKFHQDELDARLNPVKEDAEKQSPLEKQEEALRIAKEVIHAARTRAVGGSVQEAALDMGDHAIALAEEFLENYGAVNI